MRQSAASATHVLFLMITCRYAVQVAKMCTVRDLLVMSRHGLVPGGLAHINKHTGTPLRMIALYGVCSCAPTCHMSVSTADACAEVDIATPV